MVATARARSAVVLNDGSRDGVTSVTSEMGGFIGYYVVSNRELRIVKFWMMMMEPRPSAAPCGELSRGRRTTNSCTWSFTLTTNLRVHSRAAHL
jgi:hypothetical protein